MLSVPGIPYKPLDFNAISSNRRVIPIYSSNEILDALFANVFVMIGECTHITLRSWLGRGIPPTRPPALAMYSAIRQTEQPISHLRALRW